MPLLGDLIDASAPAPGHCMNARGERRLARRMWTEMREGHDDWSAVCVVCSDGSVERVWRCGGPAEVCVLAGGTRCPQPGRGDDVLRGGAQRILGEE